MSRSKILRDISDERDRQNEKWGDGAQDHLKNGTGVADLRGHLACAIGTNSPATLARLTCDAATTTGCVTFAHILFEEMCEALEETDAFDLRGELVQVAAVCVKWIEKLDRVDLAVPDAGGDFAQSSMLAKHFGRAVAAPAAERCKSRRGDQRCVLKKGRHPEFNHRSTSAIWAQDEETLR